MFFQRMEIQTDSLVNRLSIKLYAVWATILKTDVCGHGFRGMACSALVQSTLFQKEAVEKQMSHQERDQVRLAYTHQAEYLDERKAMINWWSDYLKANRTEHITPYDFTKQLLGEENVIQFKYAKLVG